MVSIEIQMDPKMRVLTQKEKDHKPVKTFLEKCEHHWEENKIINKLWNEVDWDQWVFIKSMVDYGSLQMMVIINGLHTTEQAHKDWAEQYINPRLKQLGIA